MRQKTQAILLVVATVIALAVSVAWVVESFERRFDKSFTILEARRPYAPSNTFLSETDALAIAKSALDTAGYPSSEWRPVRDDRSKAPDGRPDEYLVRNAIDPDRGWLMFRNESRQDWFRELFVSFSKVEGGLEVRVFRGK